MDKFMFLFKGDPTINLSPEAMQAHMQKWNQWMQGLAQKGTFVAGEPLERTGKQVKAGGKVVTDGPYSEAKEIVGGYLIVDAKDINDAVDISKGCPIFETDGT